MSKKTKHILVGGAIIMLLVFLDQITKQLAIHYLMNKEPYVIIEGVFELQYLENYGAAFGMMQNQQWIFYVVAVFVLSFLVIGYLKLPEGKRFIPLRLCAAGIASGALGNFIDRLRLGYVVDFIYFKLIDFPIFNMADCYVTVFTALMAILILFKYKEDELSLMIKRKEA